MRSTWSRRRRRTCRRCPTRSGARSSSWPTAWSTATASRRLEVHRPDGVRGERGGEALNLVLHVGLGEAHQIVDQALRAAVELLVEAIDDGLLEDPEVRPLAVGAAQQHLPLGQRGLFPLHGVDESTLALGADVEVRAGGAGDRNGVGGRGLSVEVDDLDLATGGEDHAADVVGVFAGLAHDLMGSAPYIGIRARGLDWTIRPIRVSR